MESHGNDDRKEIVLKKESALININNDEISTIQRKFINVCLYVAKQQIEKKPNSHAFQIPFSTLRDLAGVKTTDLNRIKKDFEALQDKKVKYNITRKGRKKWGSFPYIGGVDFEDYDSDARKKGHILITFDLPHQILESIQNPEVYAYIDLLIVKGLQSKYSIALYEIARDYYKVGTKTFSTSDIRELLGVGDKYTIFSMFEKRVIKPAVLEISEKTDIDIKYYPITKGRKKEKIKFFFRKNSKEPLLVEESISYDIGGSDKQGYLKNFDQKLHDDLLHHGLKPDQIKAFLNDPNIGIDGITEGFEYFKKQLAEDKIHTNKPAYLAQSIQKKWGEKTPEEKAEEQRKKEIEAARASIKENKEILDKLKEEVSEYFDEKVSEIIQSFNPDVKDALETECASQLGGFEKQHFKESEMFRNAKFKGYIRERFVKESEEDVLERIAKERKVDIVQVEGKISEAQGVLKEYGVAYVDGG